VANLEQSRSARSGWGADWALAPARHTGLVPNANVQANTEAMIRQQILRESHERSRALGLVPTQLSDFSSQRCADFKITKERSNRLYAQALPVMDMLLEQVKDTASMVVLTDDTGIVLRTACQSTFMEQAERVALREGVSWAEASKGTNAIGTALMIESDVVIHANEHYVNSNHMLTCSAAPIFDPSGGIIGVLDVTGDRRSFHPHTLGLVKMSARLIEKHWFRDSFRNTLCLHFHPQPELLGTMVEGIVALDTDGRIQGINPEGLGLLKSSCAALRMQGLHGIFGETLGQMLSRLRAARSAPIGLRLTNGQVLYARADFGDSGLDHALIMPRQAGRVGGALDRETSAPTLMPLPSHAPAAPGLTLERLGRDDTTVRGVVDKLRRVIDKDIPILILGDTGTGKELLARAIHQASQRQQQAFVAVNCASIPESLIESELFGYEEGAFTGAKRKGATGKLLQANGGTLLLDEIGDMPLALQARLLRVLQERQVTPLGSARSIAFDVNVICATHRNLRDMMAQNLFREDLYFRVNGLSVKLPRLAERSDLEQLCASMLQELAPNRHHTLAPDVLAAFKNYVWPGNVRQLHGVLRTAVIMAGVDARLSSQHLPDDLLEELQLPLPTSSYEPVVAPSQTEFAPVEPGNNIDSMAQVKMDSIRHALQVCGGNVSLAARQLNVSRNTIYRKLRADAKQQ
jgi:sigma-54 dependent transcriptional regulator, acetoin dehydrogenase operon transcriptional activator AcoR